MNDKKLIISFLAATLAILGGGVYILSTIFSSSQIVTPQNVKVLVGQKNHDWGNIPYSGGNVSKTFSIKNTGTGILQLTNIKTSCACTYAQVSVDGETSPNFGMHTTSSWIGDVTPGKEAQLTVVFDPAFHGPTGVGPVTRLVSVETNDINNKQVEFTLTGTVVK